MNVKRRNFRRISVTAIAFVMLLSCMLGSKAAHAGNISLPISAKVYDLDQESPYIIDEASLSKSTAIGTLSINGDVSAASAVNSFPAYEVNSGNASFTYKISPGVLNRAAEEWNVDKDKTKKVNGLTLDKNILSGALILQTSFDGVSWTENVLMSDIFGEEADTDGFYTTKAVQLQNGCYYRVIVAYKMKRRLEDSKVLFVTTPNHEFKRVAEVYEFYVFCETDGTHPDATPMKKLGSKINTGKDNGYSGNEPIDKDDPHYGWDIGYFYVNGYTRETVAADQTPVFLKNVGDKITLWFHLSEDIAKLRGNEHLIISKDTNGYDRTFEIEQTNFERGTLIIQYTNSHGEVQDPIIYTDYLAANAVTGANTKVQLFEEGDYVVSLDYEIKSMSGPLHQIANYTNYKIMFEFSIRNGNCMVFPFDNLTGAELADKAITENGFKLDMAKSKYLTIDVQRSLLVVSTDGCLVEDVRFNRPAKDGETYISEGIYTFDVTNLYTDQHTTKTIYVGANNYLRALSATGMSIAELNAEIERGAIVHEDGTVEVITLSAESESADSSAETESESIPSAAEESDTEIEAPADNVSFGVEKESQKTNIAPFVIGIIAVVFVVLTFAVVKRKKVCQERSNEDEVRKK